MNNAELVRRLQAVGEHGKAALLHRSIQTDRMSQGLRATEQHISAAHANEQRENEADLAGDMAEGVLGGTPGAPERHRPVARIGHAKAPKLDGEDAEGKLAHRYGLQAVPNFEQAIPNEAKQLSLIHI